MSTSSRLDRLLAEKRRRSHGTNATGEVPPALPLLDYEPSEFERPAAAAREWWEGAISGVCCIAGLLMAAYFVRMATELGSGPREGAVAGAALCLMGAGAAFWKAWRSLRPRRVRR